VPDSKARNTTRRWCTQRLKESVRVEDVQAADVGDERDEAGPHDGRSGEGDGLRRHAEVGERPRAVVVDVDDVVREIAVPVGVEGLPRLPQREHHLRAAGRGRVVRRHRRAEAARGPVREIEDEHDRIARVSVAVQVVPPLRRLGHVERAELASHAEPEGAARSERQVREGSADRVVEVPDAVQGVPVAVEVDGAALLRAHERVLAEGLHRARGEAEVGAAGSGEDVRDEVEGVAIAVEVGSAVALLGEYGDDAVAEEREAAEGIPDGDGRVGGQVGDEEDRVGRVAVCVEVRRALRRLAHLQPDQITRGGVQAGRRELEVARGRVRQELGGARNRSARALQEQRRHEHDRG
jgi:hypothetical protein